MDDFDVVIRVEGLGKKYLVHHEQQQRYSTVRDSIAHRAKTAGRLLNPFTLAGQVLRSQSQRHGFQEQRQSEEEFWALKDVSFEIRRGERVGIIGRNGAGKSTLLKILSRITEPTTGRVEIRGRVASLLEVGTGFHPELTGRENIYLNGAILGMTQREIRLKFDEIVGFAEVEKFLDTPVKRYSSGMYVRLAFAVAAYLEPEILVVDEVLAVGDSQFQKKCLGKLQDVSEAGRTVLFVSHNLSALLQLTSYGILLDKGQVIFQGTSEKAVETYSNSGVSESTIFYDVERLPRKFMGNQDARFISLRFDRQSSIFYSQEPLTFFAKFRAIHDIPKIRFSMTLFTSEGIPVGSCFSHEGQGLSSNEVAEVKLVLKNPSLAPGKYYCGIAIGKGDHKTGHLDYDVILDTLWFEIRPHEGEDGTMSSWTRVWGSIIFPEFTQLNLVKGGLN